MSLKESIIQILKESYKEMSVKDIYEIYFVKYPERVKKKILSYEGKKTDKEVYIQIKAEISSICSRTDNIKKVSENPSKYIIKEDNVEKNVIKEPIIEEPVVEENISEEVKETEKGIYFCDDDYKIIKVENKNDEIIFTKTNKTGYTYVLNDIYNGYKIGRTGNNPEKRLKSMKTGNPNLSIYFVIPFESKEKELHKKFEIYRKPGTEFFFPCVEIDEWVKKEADKIVKLKSMYEKFEKINKLKSENLKDFKKIKLRLIS